MNGRKRTMKPPTESQAIAEAGRRDGLGAWTRPGVKELSLMKVCEKCGLEIGTRDGENVCRDCDGTEGRRRGAAVRAKANRQAREAVMQSLGLVKVKGALGGVYWE